MENTPFHYEVRFNLLAYDAENNFEIEAYSKICRQENPLEARIEAFEMFEEYMKFLKENNRLSKDDRGNFIINRPAFVKESISNAQAKLKKFNPVKNSNFLLEMANYLTTIDVIEQKQMKKFKEHIEIVLVIDSNDIFHASGLDEIYQEREYIIHRISSYDNYGEQQIIDNLEGVELTLFRYLKIDVSQFKKNVLHFGVDYGESGEDMEGAQREILVTPHIWCPMEEYRTYYPEGGYDKEDEEVDVPSEEFDYLDIIENGESNQVEFKPTLIYNFKTQKAGISVKYIIAKTIAGFLNSNGGLLFVGVKDDKTIQGLEYDYSLNKNKDNKDYVLLELDSTISYFLNSSLKPLINGSIHTLNGKEVLIITVNKSKQPVFLKNKRNNEVVKEFFTRMHASTHQIVDIENIIQFLFNKNEGK